MSRPASAPSAERIGTSPAIGPRLLGGQESFDTLKRRLATAPVLRSFESGSRSAVTAD